MKVKAAIAIFIWLNLNGFIKCQCTFCPPQITTSTTTSRSQCTCNDTATNCQSLAKYCSILNMQDTNPCRCTCGSCPKITTTIARVTYSSTTPVRCDDINPVTCLQFKRYCFLLEGINPHPCLNTCRMC